MSSASASATSHTRRVVPVDAGTLRAPARVLVVAPGSPLARHVGAALGCGRCVARVEPSVVAARQAVVEWRPHLAVVGTVAGDDGVANYIRELAAADNPVPVIAVTERRDLKTTLAAFERGAQDVMPAPFSAEELRARALVILRRTYRAAALCAPVINVGELQIDVLKRQVRAGNTELHLTSREQSLLYLLAANAGRLVTREEILDNLWGVDRPAESNVVDRHIHNLRAKLADNWRRPRFIATAPGRGYRLRAPARAR